MSDCVYSHSGDSTVIIKIGSEISLENNRKTVQLTSKIINKAISGVIEVVPAYNSIGVVYDPSVVVLKKLLSILRKTEREEMDILTEKTETVHIPVIYGGSYGPDLGYVCAFNSLSPEEVARLHSEKEYLIYMMGFTPGFPYLADVNEAISTPRKETPREKIIAGSVGIAGNQTGIYPLDTPGGWQIIGRTPLKLFDANKNHPFLLKPGQYIKFVHIDEKEYFEIDSQVKNGIYSPVITYRECGVDI